MADKTLFGERQRQLLKSFILEFCEPPQYVTSVSSSEHLGTRKLWTMEVDCMRLIAACPEFGNILFFHTMSLMDALKNVCAELCRDAGRCLTATDFSPRLTHLPTVGAPPPSMPPSCGVLVSVSGTIVRMTTKRVVPFLHKLKCGKCSEVVEAVSSPFDRGVKPRVRCKRKECGDGELHPVGQLLMDYAECRLQQRSNLSGRLPRTLLVTLEDELTTKCTVGQLVEVVGLLYPKWRATHPNSRPIIESTLWAINISTMESYRENLCGNGSGVVASRRKTVGSVDGPTFSPEAFFLSFGKDKLRRTTSLVASVCPQLSGLFAPRMAIILAVVGGTSTTRKTSMHIRSTIHCLFVGDPSTGKSQLLRYASLLAPRSTSTSGVGSTSAGLTVAAAKENGEWVLEPGALVLSDGGVCVIDELRTVSSADRASLHEAMEQQTISVAKAGMVTKLRTCCSVISACNPPTKRNVGAEIGVGGPLLSRFDFIFLLWDRPSAELDSRIATHILACTREGPRSPSLLTQEDVSRYLRWVHFHYSKNEGPLLSDQAAELLQIYYELQHKRGASSSLADCLPVTVRLLESLVRITQAHAKLHLESICTEEDAALAIFLMEQSAHSMKCPLESLGPEIYTNSKCLEDCFFDLSNEGVCRQRNILKAITDVFLSAGGNCGGARQTFDDSGAVTLLEGLRVPSTERGNDVTPPSLCQHGKREREKSGYNNAVLRSARRLEASISSPTLHEQTVVQYIPNFLSQHTTVADVMEVSRSPSVSNNRRRNADEIMRSLAYHQ